MHSGIWLEIPPELNSPSISYKLNISDVFKFEYMSVSTKAENAQQGVLERHSVYSAEVL